MEKPSARPPKIVLNAVEKWGKTSCGAFAPRPVILMSPNERGYETLVSAGRAPLVPHATVSDWESLLEFIPTAHTQGETLVLDAMGGFERLCHSHVCMRDYGGDWGEKGFSSFQKGYDSSVRDWLILLSALERANDNGMAILILSHAKVTTIKNPMGADYDRYVADCHAKTWSVTHKWADALLFGNFFTKVEGGSTGEKARKGKGVGDSQRIVYTERRDAYDAGNRYGMAPELDIPDDPKEIWNTVNNAMKGNE